MDRRATSRPAAFAAMLGVSALIGACAPCAADEPRAFLNAPDPPPATPAHRPVLRLKPAGPPSLALELHLPPKASADAAEAGPVLPATRSDRMKRAFEAELREEAIRSRRAALYATIPSELPELLEDDYIRKQQSRVAESVIGDAFEAAVSEGFFKDRFHESKFSVRPLVAARDHGLRIDASPSWTYRVSAPRGGFRVDVPLTPSSIRLHAYKDLQGTNRRELRFGAGLLIDPFDEEVRAGFSFQF